MGRTIEMFWKCSHCQNGELIKGREMNCPTCGNPKDKSEKYIMPNDTKAEASVSDPSLLKLANAGANWECSYCGGHERNLTGQCRSCAGSRVDLFDSTQINKKKIPDIAPILVPSAHPEEIPYVVEPIASFVADQSKEMPRIDSSLISTESATSTRWHPRNWWKSLSRVHRQNYLIGGIITLILAFVLLMIFLFRFHGVIATVQSIYWQHSITLEQKTTYHSADWRSEMHYGAYNLSCSNRFKKYVNCHPYNCNPHSVSHNCNPYDCNCHEVCTSNENGFASCHDSCSTCYHTCTETEYDTCYEQCPVYEDYCSYDYDQWDEISTKIANGSTHETSWPDLHANGKDQRTQAVAIYQIDFVWENDNKKTIKVDSFKEFMEFSPGDIWNAEANRVGMFRLIAPSHQSVL